MRDNSSARPSRHSRQPCPADPASASNGVRMHTSLNHQPQPLHDSPFRYPAEQPLRLGDARTHPSQHGDDVHTGRKLSAQPHNPGQRRPNACLLPPHDNSDRQLGAGHSSGEVPAPSVGGGACDGRKRARCGATESHTRSGSSDGDDGDSQSDGTEQECGSDPDYECVRAGHGKRRAACGRRESQRPERAPGAPSRQRVGASPAASPAPGTAREGHSQAFAAGSPATAAQPSQPRPGFSGHLALVAVATEATAAAAAVAVAMAPAPAAVAMASAAAAAAAVNATAAPAVTVAPAVDPAAAPAAAGSGKSVASRVATWGLETLFQHHDTVTLGTADTLVRVCYSSAEARFICLKDLLLASGLPKGSVSDQLKYTLAKRLYMGSGLPLSGRVLFAKHHNVGYLMDVAAPQDALEYFRVCVGMHSGKWSAERRAGAAAVTEGLKALAGEKVRTAFYVCHGGVGV